MGVLAAVWSAYSSKNQLKTFPTTKNSAGHLTEEVLKTHKTERSSLQACNSLKRKFVRYHMIICFFVYGTF